MIFLSRILTRNLKYGTRWERLKRLEFAPNGDAGKPVWQHRPRSQYTPHNRVIAGFDPQSLGEYSCSRISTPNREESLIARHLKDSAVALNDRFCNTIFLRHFEKTVACQKHNIYNKQRCFGFFRVFGGRA
jgi:hypothetical protein